MNEVPKDLRVIEKTYWYDKRCVPLNDSGIHDDHKPFHLKVFRIEIKRRSWTLSILVSTYLRRLKIIKPLFIILKLMNLNAIWTEQLELKNSRQNLREFTTTHHNLRKSWIWKGLLTIIKVMSDFWFRSERRQFLGEMIWGRR